MKNLEFQWLILKIDQRAAKKGLACLLCWFATKYKTGRWITLQRFFCLTKLYRSIVLCWNMKNLEFQWLILKIDETAAKKWLACPLCWFSTKVQSGRRITLQRSFSRSRYFTVLLYYARTWRISSFSGLYWKLTKRRQKNGQHAFSVDSPLKIRLDDG